MTTPADDLYQRLVLDHARAPRNRGPLPGATHVAHGDNPFCGDRVTVSLIVEQDGIADARFDGSGCAVATAAASMMTAAIKGLTRAEAAARAQGFERWLAAGDGDDGAGARDEAGAEGQAEAEAQAQAQAELGELRAFAGVRRFPVRVKCARLPWQTMVAALARADGTVSTE